MKIRPYAVADRAAVILLWQACGLAVPHNDPGRDIDRKLKVDPELFLVGVEGPEVVASVMGGYEGHRGWINYLAVSPDCQRKGYGLQLMQAIEVLLRERGCPKINLQVRSANTAIIGFYQALGYKIDDVVGLGKRLEHDEG